MLNCCIKHKLSHQQKLNTPNIKTHSSSNSLSYSQSSPSSSYIEFLTPSSSLKKPTQQKDIGNNSSSSEDEFYEAFEDVPQKVESEHETSEMETSESDNHLKLSVTEECTNNERSSDTMPLESLSERQGELKQYGDLVLINTGQPLYIPVTQVGAA